MGNSRGNKKAEQPTFYDKCLRWLKNNKITAILLGCYIVFGGLAETVKKAKEMKENLFGTQGLFSPQDTTKINLPIAGTINYLSKVFSINISAQ
ncbi:hypothetical protein [Chitinophaga flava]|uniref:Uncharacterized protein n=1 Tax=Chitinophaga flava TaxID=2259036 RepID=A0A365XZA6_9BACT|nr:hypothetical protein [Chitinophaga flava]RBL91682.1 hypothetical protein DF182_03465 [Chitinophaga flava]